MTRKHSPAGRVARLVATLGLLALAAPLTAMAQPAGKVWRIGILEPYAPGEPVNNEIRQYLRELGYGEGRNIAIEWRHGAGQTNAFPALAADLVRRKLDALVAIGEPAIRAAREATKTVPIIAGSDDLVGEGHLANLRRPGGNVTGVTILASELNAKRLELLNRLSPPPRGLLSFGTRPPAAFTCPWFIRWLKGEGSSSRSTKRNAWKI